MGFGAQQEKFRYFDFSISEPDAMSKEYGYLHILSTIFNNIDVYCFGIGLIFSGINIIRKLEN